MFLGFMPFEITAEQQRRLTDPELRKTNRLLIFSTMRQILEDDTSAPGRLANEDLIRWPELQSVAFNDAEIKPVSTRFPCGFC